MSIQSLIAWRESPMTLTHDTDVEHVTLHDLHHPAVVSTLALQFMTKRQFPARMAYMMVMHYAIDAMTIAWIAPLIRDYVHVDINAHDIGLILDAQSHMYAVWIHPDIAHRIEPMPPALNLGTSLAPVIDGLVDSIHNAGQIGRRGVAIACIETLVRRITSLERRFGGQLPLDWQQQLMRSMQYALPSKTYSFNIHPDAGPDIEIPVPTVCCVLSKHADADACPTCPQHASHDIRRMLTEQWVATLSDDEFLGVTGRRRIWSTS